MANYTLEQKAAAFDALWNNCGDSCGTLHHYVSRHINRSGCPPNEAKILRVPCYEHRILAEGELPKFRDVLHYLATRERAGGGNG